MSDLLFAPYKPKNLEPKNSIGAKWLRLLDKLALADTVAGKRVAVKMHLGGGTGFTTIHPLFVRQLVEKLKAAGAKEVFVTDAFYAVRDATARGYTAEVIGCPIVSDTGTADRYFYTHPIEPAFRTLTEVQLAGEIMDADVLVDFAHVKGHGACGFGGASKNLSMGCVTNTTRSALHRLEGGLEWDAARCDRCGVCIEHCAQHAISFNKENQWTVFYHDCKFCQHCVLICPQKAVTMVGGRYKDFQQGMALTSAKILHKFGPQNTLFINVLTNITVYCDCWGMTTPTLVPDIGILAGRDIAAIEQGTLDLIRTEDLIAGALTPGMQLGPGTHLFEKIHGKDPHAIIDALEQLGCGSRNYTLQEVE